MQPRRGLIGLYGLCVALLIALSIYPVRSGAVRLLIAGCVIASTVGAPLFLRRKSAKAFLLGLIALLCAFVVLLPGRPVHAEQLRTKYVEALSHYVGGRYVWGGENARGVDCSGIVRAAWFDAQIQLALKTANVQLLRQALSAWWFDASAKELAAGYGGRTRPLHSAKSIRANRDEGLLPGDFAIVARGVHALAYLGDQTWIEADPGAGKVIVLKTGDPNAWLDSQAVFVRWKELD